MWEYVQMPWLTNVTGRTQGERNKETNMWGQEEQSHVHNGLNTKQVFLKRWCENSQAIHTKGYFSNCPRNAVQFYWQLVIIKGTINKLKSWLEYIEKDNLYTADGLGRLLAWPLYQTVWWFLNKTKSTSTICHDNFLTASTSRDEDFMPRKDTCTSCLLWQRLISILYNWWECPSAD